MTSGPHLRALRTLYETGALFCGDLDLEEWRAKNRAPIYPEQWNVWLLNRTLRDNPSANELDVVTKNVMAKIFAQSVGVDHGQIDHLEIRSLYAPQANAWGQYLDEAKKAAALSSLQLVKNRSSLDPIPFLVAGPSTQLVVSFVLRGSSTSIPWPCWKAQVLNPWCPIEADYTVESVYAPPPRPVPPEPAGIDKIHGTLPVPSWTSPIALGSGAVLLLAGAIGVAYVARSFR